MPEGLDAWRRVLVVDDGSILLGALGAALGDRGYEVLAVTVDGEGQDLGAAIARYCPHVVLAKQWCLERCAQWLADLDECRRQGITPKFLALRQDDQATKSAQLRRNLRQPITLCTPADLQNLLP